MNWEFKVWWLFTGRAVAGEDEGNISSSGWSSRVSSTCKVKSNTADDEGDRV